MSTPARSITAEELEKALDWSIQQLNLSILELMTEARKMFIPPERLRTPDGHFPYLEAMTGLANALAAKAAIIKKKESDK